MKEKGKASMAALIFYVCGCIAMPLSPEDLPTRAKSLTFARANDEETFDVLTARVNGYTSNLFSYTPEDTSVSLNGTNSRRLEHQQRIHLADDH